MTAPAPVSSSPSYSVEVPAGFDVPDFAAPLDVDAHLAAVPDNAVVKGQFNQAVIDAVAAAGKPPVTSQRYAPFREYAMREHVQLLVDAARAIHPDLPLREALRRIGRGVFPAFTATLLGKIMYGVFGSNVGAIFRIAQKSFEIAQSTGRVDTVVVDPCAVRLRFSNTHTFVDSNHFGVVEGTLTACKVQGTVHARIDSPIAGELFVRWIPRE